MKAIILIGGLGTRLRPLTYSTPKSLLPIANEPFLRRSLSWFRRHGIREFVLALSNQAAPIVEYVSALRTSLDFDVEVRLESLPLGSGGALRNCADLITETCLLYNGDILTDLDIGKLVAFHRQRGAAITATFNEVDDPTHYGVPELDANNRVLGWQEKPTAAAAKSRYGNVGVWVVEPTILSHIPNSGPVSLEKETFPRLLRDEVPFFGYCFDGYWKDIGTVEKYVDANRDVLLGRVGDHEVAGRQVNGVWVGDDVIVPPGSSIEGKVVIGSGSVIGEQVRIVGPTVIGSGCLIADGASVSESIIWDNGRIGPRARVESSVIGSAEIGAGAVVSRGCVVSSDSRLGANSYLPPSSLIGPGSSLTIGRS
jgi:NDP-sugar pyrophosphorylase family protein